MFPFQRPTDWTVDQGNPVLKRRAWLLQTRGKDLKKYGVFDQSFDLLCPDSPLLTVFSVLHQSGRLCQVLRGRVSELEAELAEQSHLRLQAMGESEFLKAELDDLRRVREDTEKEQRSLTEIESKSFFIVFQRLSTGYKSLRNTGRTIQSNTSALWWPWVWKQPICKFSVEQEQ